MNLSTSTFRRVKLYYGLGTIRTSSGWLGGLLGRWKKESPQGSGAESKDCHKNEDVTIAPRQILQKIALEHIPTLDRAAWQEVSLGSTQLKGKILCTFENTFKQKIPNHKLSSITTFSDLLELLHTTSQQQQHDAAAVKVFPNIVDDGTLPPNLHIQFISTEPKQRPRRRPFQNFDARRPEHATFLSKEERERRKQKRRHLTAWK